MDERFLQYVARAEAIASHLTARREISLREVVILVVAALVPLLYVLSPGVLVSDMPLDIFVPLDGGWRVASGQVPHVDFHTPVGRLYYDAYGWMMGALDDPARAILWVPVATLPFLVGAVLVATRDRLPGIVRVLTVIGLGYMAVSPIHLDRDGLVHLASYNRIGWAIVTVIALAATLPRQRASRAWAVVDALAATTLLVVLFFLKITYFALGGFALLLAVALVPRNRWWALAAGIATWVVIGVCFAMSEVPWAYVEDIRGAAASFDIRWAEASGDRAPGLEKLTADLVDNLWIVLIGMVGLAAFARRAEEGPELEREANRVGLLGLGLLVACLVIGIQSHDHHNPSLLAVALLPIGFLYDRADRGVGCGTDRRIATLLATLVLLVVAPRALRDAGGMLLHRSLLESGEGQVAVTDDPTSPVASLRFVAQGGVEAAKMHYVRDGRIEADVYRELLPAFDGADLTLMLLDGAAAIERHGPPNARALALLFTSPFPVVTGAPPPTGTLSWYHPSRTFGGDNPIVPEVLLADVDVVLVPATVDTIATQALREVLEPWLNGRWERVDEPLWTLYVRPRQAR